MINSIIDIVGLCAAMCCGIAFMIQAGSDIKYYVKRWKYHKSVRTYRSVLVSTFIVMLMAALFTAWAGWRLIQMCF